MFIITPFLVCLEKARDNIKGAKEFIINVLQSSSIERFAREDLLNTDALFIRDYQTLYN